VSSRLDAIRNRELWALSATEKARVLALEAKNSVQIGRGNAPTSTAAADRVWADAERRVTAEDVAADRAREKKAQEKADRKAARKWW
jgi:hypothetical protein